MNIYHVAIGELRLPVEAGGGADNFLFQVSRQLAAQGHHRVTLLERRHRKSDPAEEQIGNLKIIRISTPTLSFGFLSRIPYLSSLFLFIKSATNQFIFAIKAGRYLSRMPDADIVHFHSSPTGLGLMIGNRKLSRRMVYTSHTPRRLLKSPRWKDRVALALENWLVCRVAKVTVLNYAVRDKLLEASKMKGEIAVLPVGIDERLFNPDIRPEDVADRYGISGKTPILFVGRINPVKGVEYLITAMDILVNQWGIGGLALVLVGPVDEFTAEKNQRTPYLAKLKALINEYALDNMVKLTGPVPPEDLRRLYAACHVFVLPSLSEATPTVVLEAMACARPVVATTVGGIPEQIEENKSGFLVPPGDSRVLADKIRYLLEHPTEAQKMGAYGRKEVEIKFTWEHIAQKLTVLYQDV